MLWLEYLLPLSPHKNNSYVETLTPKVKVLGGGLLGGD